MKKYERRFKESLRRISYEDLYDILDKGLKIERLEFSGKYCWDNPSLMFKTCTVKLHKSSIVLWPENKNAIFIRKEYLSGISLSNSVIFVKYKNDDLLMIVYQ